MTFNLIRHTLRTGYVFIIQKKQQQQKGFRERRLSPLSENVSAETWWDNWIASSAHAFLISKGASTCVWCETWGGARVSCYNKTFLRTCTYSSCGVPDVVNTSAYLLLRTIWLSYVTWSCEQKCIYVMHAHFFRAREHWSLDSREKSIVICTLSNTKSSKSTCGS